MPELRQLGRTEIRIPRLVFGATSLGNLFRLVPEQDKSDIVASWLETGFQPVLIDSAGKYGAGLSLEVIGRELSRLGVPAENVLISNKLAWRRVPLRSEEPTFEPGAWFGLEHDAVQDISYDGILRCFEDGEQLLGDYGARIVSVHDPDEYLAGASDADTRLGRLKDIIDAYRALVELRAAGRVAAVGVGAKDWRVIEELSQHCDFDWVMFANSFTIMHHPPELIEFMTKLGENQVGIINSALFHGGFLLGGEFFDYRRVDPNDEEDAKRIQWRSRFSQICDEFDLTVFQAGVAFGLAHPAITAVALSSSRAARTPSHVEAISVKPSAEFWQRLKQESLIRQDCGLV